MSRLTSAIAAFLLSFGIMSSASAVDIDVGFRDYQKQPGHKALAFSQMGYFWYRWGEGSSKAAQSAAMARCKELAPDWAEPCVIGAIDDKVVNSRLNEVVRGVYTGPASAVLTDRKSGRQQKLSAVIRIERYWSRSPTISLRFPGGRTICEEGRVSIFLGVRFSIKCGDRTYSGAARQVARVKSGKWKGMPIYESTLRAGDSTLVVRTGG